MLRCLLILALASNQLLFSGHGGMLYVCMGSDGEFCLETDPETCTCCKDGRHNEADHDTNACSCSCKKRETGLSLSECTSAASCETFVTNEYDCGCLHLIISNGQSAPATRMVHSFDLEWNRFLAAFSLPDDYCPACNLSLQSISDTGFAFCKPTLDARSLVMRC